MRKFFERKETKFGKSRIVELQYLNTDERGWTQTNEDHLLLLEGLKGIRRQGGFFSVGEFQVLDIALELGAEVIVLGDLDLMAVKKNLAVLQIVESSNDVSEVLPRIIELIERTSGVNEAKSFAEKMTVEGNMNGARVRLAWAHSQTAFQQLKNLIQAGRVAVAQVDITKPETMGKIGAFFQSFNVRLESAYLSNTISFNDFDTALIPEHKQAVNALYKAAGHDKTLLIRSGPTTNPVVIERLFNNSLSPSGLTEMVQNIELDRVQHYGKKICVLPETIERPYTGKVFMYAYDFFVQELVDYHDHLK